jgi:hypothetical protein
MNFNLKSHHLIGGAYFIILLSWFSYFRIYRLDEEFFLTQPNTFYFKPFLSSWFAQMMHLHVNVNFINLICIIVIPYSIYLLLVKIYSRYINLVWSSFLALLSISVYEDLSFHSFLLNVLNNNWLGNKGVFPLIFEFPLPGLSTLYFLLIYFFLTNYRKNKIWLVSFFSVIVAIDFYVNAIDSLFLIAFWLVYFPLKIYREYKYSMIEIFLITFFQIVIIFSIIIPGLFAGEVNPNLNQLDSIPSYHITLYLVIPILMMVLMYSIQRIDFYEIIFKFRHIYVFMILEILIILATKAEILPIDLKILKSRILQFFIHLLYFVPLIYYISRPVYNYSIGSEASQLASSIRKNIYLIFIRIENIVVSTLIVLLIIYNLFPIILVQLRF